MISTARHPTEQQLRDLTVDIIVTVNGGKDASYSVLRGGGLVGFESAGTRPPDNIPIEFVDWPFTKPDTPFEERWEQHLSVVKREQPRYAVAPDVDGIELEDALDYADQLAEHADVVIVVPKDVHPSAVPDEYRVGMPCQERFGPTPWKWTEYHGCDSVHLLGGSPSKHREIRKYFVPIRSLDTATVVRAAGFGSVWSEEKWLDRNDGYYTALEASVENIGASWNGHAAVWKARQEYERPESAYDSGGFPDLDLLGPDDDLPFPGREWMIENGEQAYRDKESELFRQQAALRL